MALTIIGASSHGNISMENKETANLVYSGILFLLASIFNGISLKSKFSKIMGIITLTLNLVCGIILLIFFFGMFNPSLKNDISLMLLTFLLGIEITLIIKTIITDFNKLNKNWLQQRL